MRQFPVHRSQFSFLTFLISEKVKSKYLMAILSISIWGIRSAISETILSDNLDIVAEPVNARFRNKRTYVGKFSQIDNYQKPERGFFLSFLFFLVMDPNESVILCKLVITWVSNLIQACTIHIMTLYLMSTDTQHICYNFWIYFTRFVQNIGESL